MRIPRIVIAGTHSGVGKTTLTLGLLTALRRRNLAVQPFKVGPDYIDPGLHQVAAARISHNLDSWLGTPAEVQQLFLRQAKDCDLALVEGVMGLFDGAKGQGEVGSTAQVAKLLQAPVVLVFSAKGLARSAAALVHGYKTFDPMVRIAGVIANGISSERHREFIRQTVEEELGLPLLGALRKNNEIIMPERHLGLLPATENIALQQVLHQLAFAIEEQVDLDKIIQLAQTAPELENRLTVAVARKFTGVNLAVAKDEAFHFYYQDSLDYLTEQGVTLHFFSPLRDCALPANCHGIYIGGGFPEEFLPILAANQALKANLQLAYRKGIPMYAECGGLMYLCRSICSLNGDEYAGVGLVPGSVKMGNRLAALGYVRAKLRKPCLLGDAGLELKGHEFHWSSISGLPEEEALYQVTGGRGVSGRPEGFVKGNLAASYVHLHFRYNPQAMGSFLTACAEYKKSGRSNHGE